jgi:hypothetical protein
MNLTRLLTLTLLLLFVLPTYSKKVNKDDVLKVAQKVLTDKNHSSYKIKEIIPSLYKSDTVLYFATLDKGGFLIVSADNTAPPVLGETYYGEYNTAKMPPGLLYLIERYQYSINYLKTNNIEQTTEIKSQWDNYLGDNSNPKSISITEDILSSVSPLLCTEWDQLYGYNYYCPNNYPAGCVAVAMSQILYYWNISVVPTGSHTYDGNTANFGATTYCWRNMYQNSANEANALLIYHAGISCNTSYGEDGSSAFMSNACSGFENYWGMSTSANVKSRIWYSNNNWLNMVKGELDNGRPVLYCGGPIVGNGHAWVIDGYNTNDYFNCNWGWSGWYNGYFILGDFEPGGYGPYNEWGKAIFSLYPSDIYDPGTISGPSVLTGSGSTYSVTDPPVCNDANWSFSSNIETYYSSSIRINPEVTGFEGMFMDGSRYPGLVGWLNFQWVIKYNWKR